MNTINPIPQAASPLSGSSQSSPVATRENLPINRQEVPPVAAQKDTNKAEETGESLKKMVEHLNDVAKNLNRNLQFSVDEQLDRTVITVVDSETKEVIRQIPSEEVLALAHRAETAFSAILDVLA